ncbi:MAG: LacI family transcriptional regulator [Planctomycetes bacterium]|nr:LacI family transcriptional regulator [Planctomycetota bacterium]
MITTRELAALAGVSQSTVSRCLANNPAISLETRERVCELARQNGYRIKRGPGNRDPRDRKAIAVLMTGARYTNPYLENVFTHVYNRIEEARYMAIHVNDKDETLDYHRVEELVDTGIIAGFIIINLHFNPHVHEYLERLGIPHVYLHYFGKESLEALDIIDTDNYLGGHIATQHLLSLGHTRIKVLTSSAWSDKLDSHTFRDRTAGFRAAMDAASLPIDRDDVTIISAHNYEEAYRYVRDNLDHVRGYDAIFTHNDTMAIGCINALQDNGVAVPRDISVIGYDGIEAGDFCRPALTTIYQPVAELAAATLRRLITIIQSPDQTAVRSFIQPRLLLRNSTSQRGE